VFGFDFIYGVKRKESLLYAASAKVDHYYSHYVPSFRKCCCLTTSMLLLKLHFMIFVNILNKKFYVNRSLQKIYFRGFEYHSFNTLSAFFP